MEIIKINNLEFPRNTYCVLSNPGVKILESINIAGEQFRQLNEELSKEFFQAFFQTKKPTKDYLGSLAEICILRSGLYYGLDKAFHSLTNNALPRAKLGIKRAQQEDGTFEAGVYVEDFENIMPKTKYFVTSEIIASGCTLKRAFSKLLEKYPIREWTIFSVAASRVGCGMLGELEREHEIKINLFINGLFTGLSENRTDMPFFHKEAIMPRKLEEHLRKKYGNELYEKISCCIGDGGNRLCLPKHHYLEFISRYSKLRLFDLQSKNNLSALLKETKEELDSSK